MEGHSTATSTINCNQAGLLLCAPSMPKATYTPPTLHTQQSNMSLSHQSLSLTMQHAENPGNTWGVDHPQHTDTHAQAATYMQKKLMVHVKPARLLGVCFLHQLRWQQGLLGAMPRGDVRTAKHPAPTSEGVQGGQYMPAEYFVIDQQHTHVAPGK